MSTMTGYQLGFWEADPRRWARCMEQAAATMLAQGWIRLSRRFGEVQRRRALKLWRLG